jgi:hypothetical protein
MQDIICQAIRARRLLTIHQKKGTQTLIREVEPYALYATKGGKLILDSLFVKGDYQETPPPHWCPIPLDEITSVTSSDKIFSVHHEYNPDSKKYQRAICRT